MPELRTERLVLRNWKDSDLDPWAEMNADPLVREHFPYVLDRQHAAASIEHFRADIDARGWGLWAAEVHATGEFVGFVGMDVLDDDNPHSRIGSRPGVEIGWRLARGAWGNGYATEGAGACLEYGFGPLALDEILAVTVAGNTRSQAVMRRLGMTHDPADDFDDLSVPEGPLRRAIVYRISRPR